LGLSLLLLQNAAKSGQQLCLKRVEFGKFFGDPLRGLGIGNEAGNGENEGFFVA
jgi:hypothetical protein